MSLVDKLTKYLRVPEDRRLKANVDRLVTMNQEITRTPYMGFYYCGLAYRHSEAPPGQMPYPELSPELYDEGDFHRQSVETVANDIQAIRQSILALVRTCLDLQDIRDALPECLVQAVGTELTRLKRTRPPAWSLEEGSRAHRQYLKILPKIEFFATARLMY